MATAEARAVWQRAVNRCFVQEDAKRAPKLACCQSSSSSSTKQVDSGSAGVFDPQDQSSACFMPLNRNPRFPDLSPDTRWWVHVQSGYANQKELMKEGTNPSEAEFNCNRQDSAGNKGENEVKNFTSENLQEYMDVVKMMESYEDVDGCQHSKKLNEMSFEMGSPYVITSEKAEPWWRTTDKHELASMVAQKSLDYIENCDLPPPQKMRKGRQCYSCGPRGCLSRDGLSPSLEHDYQAGYISNSAMHDPWRPFTDGHESFLRSSDKERTETQTQSQASSESGLSKAELLEALRHSQTRAREAEKAAKEAYKEKEHLVRLLFKQASQLFAYKQWLQLLQLETLYHQIKKKRTLDDSPPIVKPHWTPCEARKPRKRWHRDRRTKHNPGVTKYAIAFALGLSLVGAGLLLGWTVGWMVPF